MWVAVLIVPQHDRQQPQKREHAASQGEQKKLVGRIATVFTSPDANQEEERNEREFEEDIEQDDVAGDEHAQHARLQDQQQAIERRGAVGDRLPTHQHRGQYQQRAEAKHPQA
jgi:hypothetical protein